MDKRWTVTFVAWIVAVIATAGSLFFSEVMLLPPCVLCWYQRIAMYPLVIIFLIGLFSADGSAKNYAAPLALIGWVIAVYHNLLYYKLIPEHMSPCAQGISCTTKQIEWFGFITIPSLALASFTLMLALVLTLYRMPAHE
jgi:disulfide bond formation protein DsbB